MPPMSTSGLSRETAEQAAEQTWESHQRPAKDRADNHTEIRENEDQSGSHVRASVSALAGRCLTGSKA